MRQRVDKCCHLWLTSINPEPKMDIEKPTKDFQGAVDVKQILSNKYETNDL